MSQSGAADVLAGSAAVLFCESMMQVRHCLSLSFHLLSLPFTAVLLRKACRGDF